MTQFDYKVVPAPRRVKKVKGVRGTPDLFAMTLADAINEQARHGWEYVRAEQLVAEERRGWFRASSESYQAVLIFRRARESAGPRLAAVADLPETEPPPERRAEANERLGGERATAERLQRGPVRRGGLPPRDSRPDPRAETRPEPRVESRVEPRVEPRPDLSSETVPTPLRPVPKLGPADKA